MFSNITKPENISAFIMAQLFLLEYQLDLIILTAPPSEETSLLKREEKGKENYYMTQQRQQ